MRPSWISPAGPASRKGSVLLLLFPSQGARYLEAVKESNSFKPDRSRAGLPVRMCLNSCPESVS